MNIELGYTYVLNTTQVFKRTIVQRKFYSNYWLEEMRRFSNPWHAARNPRIELQWRLVAYARGEYPNPIPEKGHMLPVLL